MNNEEKRNEQLIDAVANLLIEKIRAKEDIGDDVGDSIEKCLSELQGNVKLKLKLGEAISIMNNDIHTVMMRIMHFAHEDNPGVGCETCVLDYVCNDKEEEDDNDNDVVEQINQILNRIDGIVDRFTEEKEERKSKE